MTPTRECRDLRPSLEAFFDGELRGPDVRRLLQHLNTCALCASEVDEVRTLGESVRMAAALHQPPARLDGLAATVVSRTRAEEAQSWPKILQRAGEDWHWFLVGAGSVTATFFTTVLLSVMLAFGPNPQREDSLAALIDNMSTPSGCLFLWATAAPTADPEDESEAVLMQVADSCSPPSRVTTMLAMESGDGVVTEAALVDALVTTMTRHGRSPALDSMRLADRRSTEAILDQLSSLRLPQGTPIVNPPQVNVHEIRYVTAVTAKAL